MHEEHLANLPGALALTVNDLAPADATAAAGTSASGSAALEAKALVERRPTLTRSVAVHLTGTGSGAVSRILGERGGRLGTLTAALDERERAAFAELAGKLLTAAYGQLPEAGRLCRLCDRAACLAGGAACPVGAACRAREGAGER
ncbi:hypothetical protein GCM10027445_68420 [Amycolatopsis endophytica]|uniref:MarR family transcriptional regulator n=1 Tax=Amycolatopsis endophytica TaxID=860233 RepID=A0A853BBP4_9PSEU|nr:MarR family transcriptional regulator [Amycolatopsis endophytica]NYI92813.1 hypothetical protein [Amycolatopsis endophytica]